jgi:hypothetical protein
MVLLGGRAGSLIIRRMGQLFIHNGISHLDIRFEKLTPQPGVARLAFSKKILVIGLEFAKINPIQRIAILGSAAHTSPDEKTSIAIIARCLGNLLALLRAEPFFTC